MEKNLDPESGTKNLILVSHSSFGLCAKLNHSSGGLQSLFSKTLQRLLNKEGGFHRKLRVSAFVLLLYIGFPDAYVTTANAAPPARSTTPPATELKFPQTAVGEIRIRNRPPEGDIEPDHLIETVPARGVLRIPANRVAVYSPSYEVVTSPKRLAELPIDKVFGINLADYPANKRTVRALSKCKNLAILILDHSDVDDEALEAVCHLPNLMRLRIEAASITAKGIGHLSCLTKLIDLSVSKNTVGNEGFAQVARIKSLRRLQATKCKIGDSGVKSLSSLPNLEHLNLADNGFITDASAPYLGRMKKLVKLNIESTGLTYLGMRHLKELPQLRKLIIHSNTLTASQKEQLATVLNRRCKIIESAENKPDIELFEPLH